MKQLLLQNRVLVTLLFFVGFVAGLGVFYKLGLFSQLTGDAHYFVGLAKSLAETGNFIDIYSFWPEAYSTGRSPGWPAILATVFFVFGPEDLNFAARLTALILHCLTVVFIYYLAAEMSRNRGISFFASLAWALNPNSIFLAWAAMSEICFVVFFVAGVLLLSLDNRERLLVCTIGGLCLGFSILIRPNYVLLPVFAAAIIFLKTNGLKFLFHKSSAWIYVALIPVTFWAVRNYYVVGEFPVISTISGETLYGANNAVVANTSDYWGYWIFPDKIPGQETKKSLSTTYNELEMNKYYTKKGVEYIKANISALPKHILGKLTRSYVPIPWVGSFDAYIAFGFRFVLYCLVIGLFPFWHKKPPQMYETILYSALAVSLVTTVVFYGCSRFSFCFEGLLIPIVAVAASSICAKYFHTVS